MRQRMVVSGLLAALVAAVPLVPKTAEAEDPIFVNWSSLSPSLTDQYDPNSENDCVAGRPQCVDAVIREMRRRFEPLGRSCDHNAAFALAYLRTTQTYQWASNQPGFFADTPWVNHEDAVFAKYYLAAYDNWAAGNRSATPEAWRIAFDAARARQVTGSGNLLLGMSAHVNRDLPFVLAGISITYPDGTTRKPDHDKVNEFLNKVVQPLLLEGSARFDPGMNGIVTPFGVGYTALFQQLAAWREQAWRNAELLTAAPTSLLRAVVAQQIEADAAATARALVLANAYPLGTTSASRDAYCAANQENPPPMPYAFGTPPAY